jgi:lysine-specific demethylase 8
MPQLDVLDRPTPEYFQREYLRKYRPCVIRGLASEWAAAQWTPSFFRSHFPGVELTYEIWDGGTEQLNDTIQWQSNQTWKRATIKEFVDLMEGMKSPSRRYYTSQFPIFDVLPQLKKAFGPLDDYFGWPRGMPSSLKEKLKVASYLWMGPPGTLSMLHFDRAHNFFVQLYGTKRWLHIDPKYTENLYSPHARLATALLHWSPVDPDHPDFTRFPKFREVPLIETVVGPGDIVFTPASWWHHVTAKSASISMNFFWFLPFHTTWALRRYAMRLLRRRLLERAGLKRAIDWAEATE